MWCIYIPYTEKQGFFQYCGNIITYTIEYTFIIIISISICKMRLHPRLHITYSISTAFYLLNINICHSWMLTVHERKNTWFGAIKNNFSTVKNLIEACVCCMSKMCYFPARAHFFCRSSVNWIWLVVFPIFEFLLSTIHFRYAVESYMKFYYWSNAMKANL